MAQVGLKILEGTNMNKLRRLLLLTTFLITTNALPATTTSKQIDTINASGGSSLTVPSVGTVFVSDTSTVTESNKTLTSPTINSGALSGTFTGTPTLSGALSLSGGPSISGAGTLTTGMNFVDATDSTKKLAFSLSGMTTAKTLTLSSTQSTNQSLAIPNVGSGDSFATLNATQVFGAGSTWNGVPVGAQYGGTGLATLTAHDVLVGNGTGNVTLISPSTSGFVLTSNGTGSDPTFQTIGQSAPTLTGSQASPQSVTAGAGIALTTPVAYNNDAFVVSNSGAVTVTATPSITACTAAGQILYIFGESASNTITLQDEAGLSGSKLRLNGNWTSGLNRMLTLACDGNGFWIEQSRVF